MAVWTMSTILLTLGCMAVPRNTLLSWGIVRIAYALEGSIHLLTALAHRVLGPPPQYAPGNAPFGVVIFRSISTIVLAIVLTPSNRLRIADWLNERGFNHVTMELKEIKDTTSVGAVVTNEGAIIGGQVGGEASDIGGSSEMGGGGSSVCGGGCASTSSASSASAKRRRRPKKKKSDAEAGAEAPPQDNEGEADAAAPKAEVAEVVAAQQPAIPTAQPPAAPPTPATTAELLCSICFENPLTHTHTHTHACVCAVWSPMLLPQVRSECACNDRRVPGLPRSCGDDGAGVRPWSDTMRLRRQPGGLGA
jgi:hypothetical protein